LVAEALMIASGGVVKVQISARLLLLGLLLLFLTASGAPKNVHYGRSQPGRWENSGSDLWSAVIVGVVAFVVGFLVAATMLESGGFRRSHRHRHHARVDWDRVSNDATAVIRKELAEWRSVEHNEATEWDELDRKLEDRLREELESNRE
jgi:hypothetical protein